MPTKRLSFALLALAGAVGLAFRAPSPALQRKLKALHISLKAPAGWTETPVIANKQVGYDYALRCPGRRLEVRYAVRDLRELPAAMRNELYGPAFETTMLNVAAGGPDNPGGTDNAMEQQLARPRQEFPPAAVQEEFGADWGVTAAIRPGPEFGQAYTYCMVVALHKKDVADVSCFYLFDDPADLDAAVANDPAMAAFHSLRFE